MASIILLRSLCLRLLTLNSSPLLRLLMAAGIYLLLMWGYLALPSAQLFAAFTALVMSAALYLWVHETTPMPVTSQVKSMAQPLHMHAAETTPPLIKFSDLQSSSVATLKLNSLKEELTAQYAQFGRDQVRLNSRGLGTWHQTPKSNGKGDSSRGGNDKQP